MESILQSLILKRFRSIRAESVTFGNPTFLVGRNGAGKSNFRDAIDFLAEAMSSSLQSVFDRRDGISVVLNRGSGNRDSQQLGLGAVLGKVNAEIASARYAFEVKATRDNNFEE